MSQQNVISKVEDIPLSERNKIQGMMGGNLEATESIMRQSAALWQGGAFADSPNKTDAVKIKSNSNAAAFILAVVFVFCVAAIVRQK